MKLWEKVYLFVVALLGIATLLLAFQHYAEAASPEESFRKDYPAVTLDNIEKTDIDDVYEVYAGGNILYYHPKTGNIIFGEMISRDFKNITVERKNILVTAALKTLPLDKAIKIGKGKNVVIEVADIDCPYCRKMEKVFDKRTDVTRYVYLFPLEKIHPDSMKKSVSVLCSSDRVKAYHEAVTGLYDGKDAPACKSDAGARLVEDHKMIARRLGIQGTPTLWVNNVQVSGGTSQIEQLLDQKTDGKEVKP